MSLYDDLGVSPDADADAINAAYRKAAKAHHPDAGGDPEAFARIGRAVAVLRDPAKRAEYDATGRVDCEADDPERQARDALMQAFASCMVTIVEQGRGASTDVMEAVRMSLAEQARQQRRELVKAAAMQDRARDSLKRLIRKGKGPDVLGNMLSMKIADMDTIKAGMERLAATFERAAAMAKDWEWQVDEAPAWQDMPRGWDLRGGATRTWTTGETL